MLFLPEKFPVMRNKIGLPTFFWQVNIQQLRCGVAR